MAIVDIRFPGNLAQVDTAQELRDIPSYMIDMGTLYAVLSLEGAFSYDSGSFAVDNGTTVLKPADLTTLQAGRWLFVVDGFARGATGLAANTFDSLAGLKAADTSQFKTANISGVPGLDGLFFWTLGNYTGQADDVNVVQANGIPLSTGAWVRQGADKVAFQQSGAGAVLRNAGAARQDSVTVKDFGAVGNGTTDDSAAFLAAATAVSAAGGGRVEIPRGTYVIQNVALTGLSNIEWVGAGATIKGPATRVLTYFNLDGSLGNITFNGIIFDMMQNVLPVYTQNDYDNPSVPGAPPVYNCPIYGNNGAGSAKVINCRFIRQYTTGVFWRLSGDMLIQNCRFDAPVCNQTFNGTPAAQWYQSVHFQSLASSLRVLDCDFISPAFTNPALGNCAVYFSGNSGYLLIRGGKTDYQGRDNAGTHRLAVYDGYGDCQNFYVLDTVSTNVMGGWMRLSDSRVARVTGNKMTKSVNGELDYSSVGVQGVNSFRGAATTGCEDIIIDKNVFVDPGARDAYTVGVLSYDWGAISRRIKVLDNVFVGCRIPIYSEGPFHDFKIRGNSCSGNGGIQIRFAGSGGIGSIESVAGTQANSRYDLLEITNNTIANPTSGSGAAGITTLFNNAALTAFVGRFVIQDNALSAVLNGSQGIIVQTMSATTANTRRIVRGNSVTGWNFNYYLREGGRTEMIGNISRTAGTAGLLDQSDGSPVIRSGNTFGDGRLQGTATLVAGTVTVSTTEILTGDRVRITRLTPGGTLGELSLGTITNGTSFVINSANAADTSVVFWENIH